MASYLFNFILFFNLNQVFLGYFGKKYFSGGVCNCKTKLSGKNVIVTGGNCGIGYETALDMAKRGLMQKL